MSSEFIRQMRITGGAVSSKPIQSSAAPKPKGAFVKGPLPLEWISAASALPGKALHVALALWYLSGLRRSKTVVLTQKKLNLFGVSRQAGYRALMALEKRGLVSVIRRAGCCPRVTILEEVNF